MVMTGTRETAPIQQRALLLATALTTAVLTSTGACAQDAAAGASTDSGAAQKGAEVPEIVISAQKRKENIQDVPISVLAVSADQLQASGITSTTDLDVLVPGLVSAEQGGYTQPHLRGIGTVANGPGVENPVALYVDGVYYGSMAGSALSLNNIEQIEVDRGPQGTLFGRNATGGLIQVITKDPKPDFQGSASVTYGNYNTAGTSVYVTDGITSNLSADLAAYFQDQGDGFGKNYFTHEDVNRTQDLSLRSKWLLTTPADTKIRLILDYEQTNYAPAYVPAPGTTPLGGPPYTGPEQGLNGYTQPYGMNHAGGVSLRVDQPFDFANLVSISAFRQSSMDLSIDGALVVDPAFVLNLEIFEEHRQFSQEFQLVSPTENRVKWVTGLYFFDASGRYNPISATGGLLGGLGFANTYSKQDTLSGAAFGQATTEVLPATNLTLGLRYTIERRKIDVSEDLGLPDGTLLGPPTTDSQKKTFSKPTWRLALDHKFEPNLLGYISYNRGFKSGGFNDDLVPTTSYAPEVLDAYEIGLKTDFFSKRLRVDAAGFFYDYKNIQSVSYPAALEVINNGAGAEVYGLDLDIKAAVAENLYLTGGLEVLHDSFTSFPSALLSTPVPGGGTAYTPFDAAGRRLSFTPDWVLNIGLDYIVPTSFGDVTLNATYSYNDGSYGEPDNRLHQAPYNVLNSQIAWTSPDETYGVRLWGKNLLDTQYEIALASQVNGDFAQYAPPRTFGITLESKF